MKKRKWLFLALAVLLTLSLASCGSSGTTTGGSTAQSQTTAAPSSETTSATASASAVPQQTETTEEHTYASMNVDQIDFGGDVDEFFDAYSDTDAALDQLQPILFSAAFAAKDFDSDSLFMADDTPVDGVFEWTAVYHLINDYEFEQSGVTQDNGNLIVSADAMQEFFADEFGATDIPEIPDSLSDLISFDGTTDKYTLVSADSSGFAVVLNDISLTKADAADDSTLDAIIKLDIQDDSGQTLKTIAVEVIWSDASSYHYAVLSAYTAE